MYEGLRRAVAIVNDVRVFGKPGRTMTNTSEPFCGASERERCEIEP